MNYKPLGNTGIDVSEISFGCVEIGMPYGLGVHSDADVPQEAESIRLLQTALERGINFYDTARSYGRSEEILGKAFADLRERVVITTKCDHFHKPFEAYSSEEIRRHIRESLETSLRLLRTDAVDLFMLHNGTVGNIEHPDILAMFDECRQKGLARTVGVSTYTLAETRKAIETGCWNVIQLPYHLMDQRQGDWFGLAHENGVGLVVRSVLFRGLLTDRAKRLHPELKRLEEHRAKYDPILAETNLSLAELAMSFVLSQPEVSSVLVGIDRMEYLQTALQRADGTYLSEELLSRLKTLAFPEPEWINLHAWDQNGWLT
ncbi:MAG: aldo/keto reductase [Phycisphaerae bacterium]|nr:aldo/keto reductase [Phycisphaerae bacterium]